MDDLKEKGRDEFYRKQTGREVRKVLAACGAVRLGDVTAEKVDRFLSGLPCSARAKNAYRRSAIGLFNFLVTKKKIPSNPLLQTTVRKGEVKRRRRALPADVLQSHVAAAQGGGNHHDG